MSHALNRIWIHSVFSTKYRMPLIEEKYEEFIFDSLLSQFKKMKSHCEIINGVEDHVHLLFHLNRNLSISQVMKQLKGGSSHFINESKSLSKPFQWQVGYAAFSVCEQSLHIIKKYIENQKNHHSQNTTIEAFEALSSE